MMSERNNKTISKSVHLLAPLESLAKWAHRFLGSNPLSRTRLHATVNATIRARMQIRVHLLNDLRQSIKAAWR